MRRERTKRKEKKKQRMIEVKKVVEEQEIWDDEQEVKRLVSEKFHLKQIHIFGKKASKRMLTRKLWNHAIDMKKVFVPRKGKVYSLSREEREEMCKFIVEQLRKEYIRSSKLP